MSWIIQAAVHWALITLALAAASICLLAVVVHWGRQRPELDGEWVTAEPQPSDEDAPMMSPERCAELDHAMQTRGSWRSCPRCGESRKLRRSAPKED
jgi:hypothetical protein